MLIETFPGGMQQMVLKKYGVEFRDMSKLSSFLPVFSFKIRQKEEIRQIFIVIVVHKYKTAD